MNHDSSQTPDQAIEPVELFEILVRENADSLTTFLRASVQDHAAADDLFQEAMLVAWRRIKDYDRKRPFGAWLRGIAKRLVLAYYRESAQSAIAVNEHALDYLDERVSQIEHQPGDTLEQKIAAMRECIEALAAKYRQTVELHYQENKSTDWIAAHLVTSRDAIQKRLQRARRQLADCLERKAVLVAVD